MSGIEITRVGLGASDLRAAWREAPDARSARRMLALAWGSIARQRQRLAEWIGSPCGPLDKLRRVHRYNAEGLPGLVNRSYAGPARRLSEANLCELAALVEKGPDPEKDGVVRWRQADLRRVIEERFGVTMHERTVGKQLKALGFVRLRCARSTPSPTPITSPTRSKASYPRPPATSPSRSGFRTKPASASKAR